MSGVNVTIEGDLFGSIDEIQAKLKDLSRPLRNFGEYLRKETLEQRFDKEQTPDGIKWTKKNSAYQAWKARKHPQRKINELHGNLLRSVEAQLSGKTKLLFGSVLEYAEVRQKENPFIGVNDDDIQELKEIITEFLVG